MDLCGNCRIIATPEFLSGYLRIVPRSTVSNKFDPLKKIIKVLFCYFTLVYLPF